MGCGQSSCVELLPCKGGHKGASQSSNWSASLPALLDGVPTQQVVQHWLHRLTNVLNQQRVSFGDCLLNGVQVAVSGQEQGLRGAHANTPQPPHPSPSHLLWPSRMAFSCSPYLFLIHLMPCSWASTTRGHRCVLQRIVAFSVEVRSLGSPWLLHVATSAASVRRLRGSSPGVVGMGT